MNERIILVVEDDEPKQKSIVSFLSEIISADCIVKTAESLASGIAILSSDDIVLAVVDMSIPTFDLNKDRRGGGQPQGFGGADILRFVETETVLTQSVVLTQYEEFTIATNGKSSDPRGLEAHLRQELDERFLGVMYYAGQHGQWRNELILILKKLSLIEEK